MDPNPVCCLQHQGLLQQGETVDDWHQEGLMLVAPLGIACLALHKNPEAGNKKHKLC
jgi:hypothetical protein